MYGGGLEIFMRICIYGAASNAISQDFILTTEELGRELARRGHDMVYGAGANGLMGAAARGCHEGGSHIIGVAPKFFNADGVLFEHCDELIRTDTMRERKQIMEDNADAFIIVPGGIGTYEEFFEILTLKQLNQHNKPMVVFNINGYYDTMQEFMHNGIKHNFMKKGCLELYKVCSKIDEVFDYIENYKPETHDLLYYKEIK